MRTRMKVAVAAAVVVAFSVLTLAPSGAQSSSEKPKATDVGITANEIHIAVLADVDTSFSPGLFQARSTERRVRRSTSTARPVVVASGGARSSSTSSTRS